MKPRAARIITSLAGSTIIAGRTVARSVFSSSLLDVLCLLGMPDVVVMADTSGSRWVDQPLTLRVWTVT